MLSVAEFTAMALVFLAVLRDGSCLSISGLSSSVPILGEFAGCGGISIDSTIRPHLSAPQKSSFLTFRSIVFTGASLQ